MSDVVKISDFLHSAPMIFISAWACLVLLVSALGSGKSNRLATLSALGLVLGACLTGWCWTQYETGVGKLFSGMLLTDRFALFVDFVCIVATLLTVLVANDYVEEHRLGSGELYPVLLLCLVGMMLMAHAENFLSLLIGLETMSLGVYTLVGSWPGERKSAEAGLKYFVMGAVASAFFLYGVALLYGVTGTTNLARIAANANESALFLVGMFFIVGAFCVKVALVPFHMWTPDAYEGAPTPVTGFMASAVKVAGFCALIRVLQVAFGSDSLTVGETGWIGLLYPLSFATMIVGNLAALGQRNIKRMLAYSSISHAGYLLIGVIAMGVLPAQHGAVLFYLFSYAITTLGAFATIAWLGRRHDQGLALDDWAGLAAHQPRAAFVMTLFLLSLGGVPPLAGFFAKFYVFKAALSHPNLKILVIVAAINSVIGIYYYLKPVVYMYFRESHRHVEPLRSPSLNLALVIAVVIVLVLGLLPGNILFFAEHSPLLLGR